MSDLVAITYPDQHRGAEIFASLQRMEAERLVDLEDAVYIKKDYRGNVTLHQEVSLTGTHKPPGTRWDALIRSLFAAPVSGQVASTAGGTMNRPSDYGVENRFVRELDINTPPGSSVIFILVRKATVAEVVSALSKFGGAVLHSALPPDAEQRMHTKASTPAS
jgi:uncharacterized membrane protein